MSDEDDRIRAMVEDSHRHAIEERMALDTSLRTRLVMWAIRWIVGFALIWIFTAWTGDHGWLWVAGAVVAILSLGVLLGLHALAARRARRAIE